MRLRRCLAVLLPCIAYAAREAQGQAASSAEAGRGGAPGTQVAPAGPAPPAQGGLDTARLTRFELQRTLTEIDARRRRLQAAIEPADSVLRILAADTLRLAAASRPLSVEGDSARVRLLFTALRANPASVVLRAQLLATAEATAADFTAIEAALTSRIIQPRLARDVVERSPFAAVVPVQARRPLVDDPLVQILREPPPPPPGPPAARIPSAVLTRFETALSDSAFQDYKAGLLAAFAARASDIGMLVSADRQELARLDQRAAQLARAIGQRRDDQARLDQRVLTIGVPAVAAAVIALLLAPLLYRNPELRGSIITSGMLVELLTVFLLTSAVILLGVDGRIPAEVIGTLLGGVSGYVLGRAINPPARR